MAEGDQEDSPAAQKGPLLGADAEQRPEQPGGSGRMSWGVTAGPAEGAAQLRP